MTEIIKKHFNSLSYSSKKRVAFLLLVFIITTVDWVVHPPFFATKIITVTDIETWQRKSGFRIEDYTRIFYTYKSIKNNDLLEGSYKINGNTSIKIADTFKENISVSINEDGKLNIFSGPFITFLAVLAYFIISFTFRKIEF